MNSDLSRRRVMQEVGATALAPSVRAAAAAAWPLVEGPNRPKMCLGLSAGRLSAGRQDEAGMRRVKQLGVDYVLSGGPRMPRQEADLRARIEGLKAGGLSLYNMMIGGFPNTVYGRPGRDEEIERVRESIRAAGRAGLPVIEYNIYAHRAVKGYREKIGRAGSEMTAIRLRQGQGPAAAGAGGPPQPRGDVGQHRAFPEGGGAGGREVGRPAGSASQRPFGAPQPGVGADHGDPGRLEAPDRNPAEPGEWNYV